MYTKMCAQNNIKPCSARAYKFSRYLVYLDYKYQLDNYSRYNTLTDEQKDIFKLTDTCEDFDTIDDVDDVRGKYSFKISAEESAACTPECFQIQSELVPNDMADGGVITESKPVFEVVENANEGTFDNESEPLAYHESVKTDLSDIDKYLNRFVQLYSFTWNETDAVGTTYISANPWRALANSTTIKNKLTNYAFFRGDLELKVMINASPFYYGFGMVRHEPFTSSHPRYYSDSTTSGLIPKSQLPHLKISAQDQSAGTMIVPFFE